LRARVQSRAVELIQLDTAYNHIRELDLQILEGLLARFPPAGDPTELLLGQLDLAILVPGITAG
jgi:hypothetical protein